MPILKDSSKIKRFIKLVFDMASQQKIPILDEKTLSEVKISGSNICWEVRFRYNGSDDGPIKAFLILAQYFHSIIIKKGDVFYIPHGAESYRLESS